MSSEEFNDNVENDFFDDDNKPDGDLEDMRERRLEQLKKQHKRNAELMAKGHGTYNELENERAFFEISSKSNKVVVHFYRKETVRCKIMDRHLEVLAKKHVETRFCKLLADSCPFLARRLNLWIIPTLILVKDEKIFNVLVGFTEFGNCDDFTTEMLEWRLAVSEVIDYDGDMTKPPTKAIDHETAERRRDTSAGTNIRSSSGEDDEDLDELL